MLMDFNASLRWGLCFMLLAGCKRETSCEARSYYSPKEPQKNFSAGFPERGALEPEISASVIAERPTDLLILDDRRMLSAWQAYGHAGSGFELRFYPEEGLARAPELDNREYPMAKQSKTFSERFRLGFYSNICRDGLIKCQDPSDEVFLIADMPCHGRFVRAW
jgi:hypothetical protein